MNTNFIVSGVLFLVLLIIIINEINNQRISKNFAEDIIRGTLINKNGVNRI